MPPFMSMISALACGLLVSPAFGALAVNAKGDSMQQNKDVQGRLMRKVTRHVESQGVEADRTKEPEEFVPREGCPLPSGAQWCKVSIPGVEAYHMAVYSANDIVSKSICDHGYWEDMDLQGLGSPGGALDIGGNIGYYTFALSKAGWNVTTFEPMTRNVELMKATLCQNPDLNSKVTLLNVGLGASSTTCQIISGIINTGDGITRCGPAMQKPVPKDYALRDTFSVERLDDVLANNNIKKVDFVKIDVEGFECQVFNGAPMFLSTYKPRVLHTEVWPHMQGCEPRNYLESFTNKGYQITKDEACQTKDTVAPTGSEIKNFWVCKDSNGDSLLQPDSAQSLMPPKRRVLLTLAQ